MSGRYRGQTAVFEDHAAVWVLDTVGQLVRELGEFPTSQRLSLVNPSGGGGIVTPPLGRMTVMELDTGRVFIGTAESLEVREYHRAGPLQRIMRVLNEDLAADEAFVDEVAAADPTGLQTQILTRIREQGLPLPERVPAYTAMRMDDDGYLWVKRFSLPSDTTSTWGVFAPDGSYAGHVTLPATLQVLDIGSTYILGVSTNDLDVEQVQLHRLIRGPLVGATGARH
jgi:hypothetical protein